MFEIDLAQHGLFVRVAVTLGIFLAAAFAAAALCVASMFFLAVLGDAGQMPVSATTVRGLLCIAAGFLAIGVLGPCVLVNIRGTLQSGMLPATIGFGGAFACLLTIMLLWGWDK